MLVKVTDVKIPNDAIIPCPRVEFKYTMAVNCHNCAHYDGLGMMDPDPRLPFFRRFTVRCRHPIERRLQSMHVEKK